MVGRKDSAPEDASQKNPSNMQEITEMCLDVCPFRCTCNHFRVQSTGSVSTQ